MPGTFRNSVAPPVQDVGMGRARRIDSTGRWFHVFNRGAGRNDIFESDHDRVEFERLLGIGHDRFGVEVHAYCLMGNHYHLLVRCPDGGLSEAMHQLGSVYTRHHNKRLGTDGPLFRSRFSAIEVDSDAYLTWVVRYIHRNPMAIAPSTPLGRYRWSSHRVYLGSRRCPPWMRTAEVLGMFGFDAPAFHEFVAAESAGERDIASAGNIPQVAQLAIAESDLPESQKHRLDRTICALVLDRLTGAERTELEVALRFASPATAQTSIWRARRCLEDRPALSELVDATIRLRAA